MTADAVGRPFVHVTTHERGQVGVGRDARVSVGRPVNGRLRLHRVESCPCHTTVELRKRGSHASTGAGDVGASWPCWLGRSRRSVLGRLAGLTQRPDVAVAEMPAAAEQPTNYGERRHGGHQRARLAAPGWLPPADAACTLPAA
jgi:hypothetical protein